MPSRRHNSDTGPAASRRDWMTPTEAADYLGVTIRSVRAWIAEGKLRAYRMEGGRSIRIDRADLDKLLIQMNG